MMPDKSGPARGEQITALKLIAHEILSSNELADLLAAAEETSDALDDWQTRNLQLMRRRWLHTTAVPADLLDAFTRTCIKTESVWRTARPDNYFGAILPHLETLLGLVRETATAKSEVLGVPPYEALLDLYEPGGRPLSWMRYSTIMPLSSLCFWNVSLKGNRYSLSRVCRTAFPQARPRRSMPTDGRSRRV